MSIYVFQDRSAWSNTALMFSVLDKAQNQLKTKDSAENQSLTVSICHVLNRRFPWVLVWNRWLVWNCGCSGIIS